MVLGSLLVLGILSRFIGEGPRTQPGTPGHVAFTGDARAIGVPERPDDDDRDAAAAQIHTTLDRWYRDAFGDPARFGDGVFDAATTVFAGEAAIGFAEDRNVLTIGEIAPQVASVHVEEALANLTIYFEDGLASWATAAVRFDAAARLGDDATEVLVGQRVTLVLERRDEVGWVVTNYYDAFQRQRSRPVPVPSGSGSPT